MSEAGETICRGADIGRFQLGTRKREGAWIHLREDGALLARGRYSAGVKVGRWQELDAGGTLLERYYIGQLRACIPHRYLSAEVRVALEHPGGAIGGEVEGFYAFFDEVPAGGDLVFVVKDVSSSHRFRARASLEQPIAFVRLSDGDDDPTCDGKMARAASSTILTATLE